MRLLYWFIPFCFIILLGGCCYCPPIDPVYYNYTPPTPSRFWEPECCYQPRSCDNLEDDEEALELLQKQDIVLADLIDVALRNNPTTERTWADARAAAYGIGVARSALYPTVDFQETITYVDVELDDTPRPIPMTPAPGPNQRRRRSPSQMLRQVNQANPQQVTTGLSSGVGSKTIFNSDLSISYLLFDFGGRCATIEAAKQALYLSDWTHNRQIQQVIFSVLQAYYTYAGFSALLEAKQSDLENAQTNLEAATQLFEAGVKTRLDVLQAQTDLINIQLSIVDTKGQLEVALGNLANALGLPANAHFNVPKIPDKIALEKICANIDQLVEMAKFQRPDLAAVYAEHERRRAEVTIARSAGLPTIGANIDLQSNVFMHNPSLNNHSLSASLIFNVPLFDGFLYRSQVHQAQELVRASCADIRNRENTIAFEVLRSYYDFQTAVESFAFSEEFLKFSQETYDSAQVSYQEGVSTILDLLAAQRSLSNARADRIRNLTRWAISLANVSFATGLIGSQCEDVIKCQKTNVITSQSILEGSKKQESNAMEKMP